MDKVRIHKLEVANFKGIVGEPISISPGQGVNFFIGNNNSGKTTILEAIEAIINGYSNNIAYTPKVQGVGDTWVKIILSGVTDEWLGGEAGTKKLIPYIFNKDEEGRGFLEFKRSPEEIKAIGQHSPIKANALAIKNPECGDFEVVSGTASVLGKLCSVFPIWANIDPEEIHQVQSSKILGRVLKEILNHSLDESELLNFNKAAAELVDGESSRFAGALRELEHDLEENLPSGFSGGVRPKFRVNRINGQDIIKYISLEIDDGARTGLEEKGSGLQRSLAISLLKIFSNYQAATGQELPIVLIDEPETWLHPQAQLHMAKDLADIGGEAGQVFVATHSPYILRQLNREVDVVYLVARNNGTLEFDELESIGRYTTSHPSLAEISYRAYQDVTPEYFTELFGIMHREMSLNADDLLPLARLDDRIKERFPCIPIRQRRRARRGRIQTVEESFPVYLRNLLNHPENPHNRPWAYEELTDGIRFVENILDSLVSDSRSA